MKLVTFEYEGRTGLGGWDGEDVIDLRSTYQALFPSRGPDDVGLPGFMMEFLRSGDLAIDRARAVMERMSSGGKAAGTLLARRKTRLLAPIPRPGKILAIDYNYPGFIGDARRLLKRQGLDVPEWKAPQRPWFFVKFSGTVIGPGAIIRKPKDTQTLDAEGELAVVIGKTGRFIPPAEALSYVAGYTFFNDLSDRAVEFRPSPSINHRLYGLGKNNDTFGPMGPCLFTPDEIGDPAAHTLEVSLNGRPFYQYALGDAIFSVPALISFCSQVFRLEPGDLILTGSGGGCGGFREPPIYLQPGDRVAVGIPGFPPLENIVEEERI